MTASAPAPAWDEIPDGTVWPEPDTLVLAKRDLRPGTDPARLSRFREDRWDLTPAIFEDHAASLTLNFGLVPAVLRPAAKFYIWQLLNHPEPPALKGAQGARMAVTTIASVFTHSLHLVLEWFAAQGITAFNQITQDLLDDYLDVLIEEDIPLGRCYAHLTEVRRLWAHRAILPADMRLPDAPPWAGEDTRDLLGDRTRPGWENRTRRIGEPTMQMLLRWAICFVEDLSDDILHAHAEYLELHSRMPERRQAEGTQARPGQPRHLPGELQTKVAAYLQGLRERGDALPGTQRADGQLQIRWRHLAAIMDSASFRLTATGQMVIESGLPIGEHTYLSTPITGLLDGRPWRPDHIRYDEAAELARLLSTACFILIAYLSGARLGECSTCVAAASTTPPPLACG